MLLFYPPYNSYHMDFYFLYQNSIYPLLVVPCFLLKYLIVFFAIYKNYHDSYDGIPGSSGWFIDQEIMYKKLINYPTLKVLNRPIKRLEVNQYLQHINKKHTNFLLNYDDVHFHRNYFNNEKLISHAENELYTYKK